MATNEEIKAFADEYGLPANVNGFNPQAPEFLKFWKKMHNSGCVCSTCGKTDPPRCYTIVNRSTRAVTVVQTVEPCDPGCTDGVAKTGCGDC